MTLKEGRVTIPTNLDVVPETIEFMPPIILPGRTTSGQRQARMKYSSAM